MLKIASAFGRPIILFVLSLTLAWAQDDFESKKFNQSVKNLIEDLEEANSKKEKLKILSKAEEKIYGKLLMDGLQVNEVEPLVDQSVSPRQYFDQQRAKMEAQFNEEQFLKKLKKLSEGDLDVLKNSFVDSLKEGRKNNNNLRLSFFVMDDSHTAPKNFNRFVTLWGRLNDSIAAGEKKDIIKDAGKLLDHYQTYSPLQEIDQFKPTKKTSFVNFITENYNDLNSYLKKTSLTIEEFHELRKHFKNYLNVFLSFKQINPGQNAELIKLADKIDELSTRLGDLNDIYTELDYKDVINYRKYNVEFSDKIRLQLTNVASEIQYKACSIQFRP